ncbi:poly(A) RNA polymerase GLD2-B-like [Convolutriloba macropyga]|uniref:poly(A) RNA polymerase GLD2-B-like n=1 Tax=Convolutriloba macropyga TaxID=536237 RepID=UPI003F525563
MSSNSWVIISGCVTQIQAEDTDVTQEHVTIGFHYSTYLCGFRVHLSINDVASVFHSHLLHTYNHIDSRLLHVLLPVKQWAYSEGLLDPNRGKLSGYLITLMTVFYLQAGLIKPVLPSLQKAASKLFNKDVNKYLKTWKELKAHKRLKVKSKNDCGIGELFVGFFVYYQQFQFDQFELDVVTGEVRPRVLQDANYKNIKIAIRDPFSDRVASAFVTQSSFLQEFKMKLAQMEKQLGDSTNNLEEFLSFAGNTRREEVRGQFLPSVAASPMSTAR